MKANPLGVFLLLLTVSAVPAVAHTFTIDQHNDAALGKVGYSMPPRSEIGQSFVPTLNSLDVVELEVYPLDSSGTNSAYVRIRSGTVDGAIIGTSQVTTLLSTVERIAHFDFNEALELVPGNVYVIDAVTQQGEVAFFLTDGTGPYGAGTAFLDGVALQDKDLWFREGTSTVTPVQPSTWGRVKALYR